MALRILLAADVHLGRSSSRLPDHLRHEARTRTAWQRLVDLALREKVQALLLSGDVIDESNRYWEAVGPLEAGVRRLAEAGIRVIAVAGNHDHEVLQRVADQLPPEQFTLLGRGGQWERITLTRGGRPWLSIHGWSFPGGIVRESPLSQYPFAAESDLPVLGLVHGDIGVPQSSYAPLELRHLQGLPPSAWLVGHVHVPNLSGTATGGWVLVPGSVQALDPGEPGAHGAWIAEVAGTEIRKPRQVPISSAWYDALEVDISPAEDEQGFERLFLDRLRQCAQEIAAQASSSLAHISLRVRLTGESQVAARAREIAERIREDLNLPVRGATVVIDRIEVEAMTPVDLESLAQSGNALGSIARLLLDLKRGEVSSETARLMDSARRALQVAEGSSQFLALGSRPATDERLRHLLQIQARALLNHWMASIS